MTVAAEARGRGALTPLFATTLGHAVERGAVLSTLFPTAPGIYRRFGFELVADFVTVHVPTAALQRARHPGARPGRDLGQDPGRALDQVEGQVIGGQPRIGAEQGGRHRQQLAEQLDAGEAAADHDHGQQPLAFGTGRQDRGPVEGHEQPVTDGDRFLDVLQPDGVLGDTRHRQPTGHRPGGHDHDVVAHAAEDVGEAVRDAGQEVQPADRIGDAGQRHVEAFLLELLFYGLPLEGFAAVLEGGLELVPECVDGGPGAPPLFGRQAPERLELRGQLAFFAQITHP